jgi:DNA-binding GntR family transcriptional regulator
MVYSTVGESVVAAIRKEILTGRLTPGTKIDQNRLKERFGVSAIPLREAFKQLQAEGYVDIYPHRGVRVKPLCRDEIEDLYLVRAEVEALAARLALNNLSPQDLEELENLFDQMSRLTEARAYKRLVGLNRKFHYKIYQACGRRHLLEILDDLWNRSSRYRNLVTVRPSRAMSAIEEHRRILEACISGDADALAEAVRKNVDETRKMLGQAPDSEHFPAHAAVTSNGG